MEASLNPKYQFQDQQYEFPYHWIPYLDSSGQVHRQRSLDWGMEYLCYLLHVCEKITELEPESILDVGCGDGRLLGLLDGSVDRRVGIDLSQTALSFARAFSPDVEFHRIDAGKLPGEFDVVTAIEVLEHIPDEGVVKFIRDIYNRASPGGHIILTVPTTAVPLNRKHYRHYDRALLEQHVSWADVDLATVKIEYVYRSDWIIKVFSKLTYNRLFRMDVVPLNKLVWRYVWRHLRQASPKTGRHMMATFRRQS